MFCPNCGKPVGDNDRFCPYCGTPRTVTPAPEAQASQPYEASQPFAASQPYAAPQPFPQQDQQQAWQSNAQQQWQPNAQQWQTYGQPDVRQDAQQAYQSYAQPITAKKRSGKKGVFIGLGCVALAALIGGGIWFLTRGGKPQNKLLQAAEKSVSELKAYTSSLPNLNTIVKNAEQLGDSDTIHAGLEVISRQSYNLGDGEESRDNTIQLNADIDKAARKALISGNYGVSSNGVQIPYSFYIDPDQIQAGSSALLEQGEVLALPLKDLPKQWNNSALGRMTGITLPEDLDLESIGDADLEAGLESAYGTDWKTFEQSVQVVEYEGASHFSGDGVTYTLTWDRDTLKRMYQRTDVNFNDFDDLGDLDDLEALTKLDTNELSAKLLVYCLGQASEHLRDLQFFVQDGKLTGFWLDVEAGEPITVELRLLGTNNIWERINCTVVSTYNSYTQTEIVDVTMSKTADSLRIELSGRSVDSDYPNDPDTYGPYAVVYHDSDGSLTFEEEGEEVEGAPDVRLLPVEGGLQISYKMDQDYGYFKSQVEESMTFSRKTGAIQPLSAAPTDILKLSEQELQDLFRRIQEKGEALVE